ncbi:ABC transporter substrate-binding protein [Haladaptatus pallidirubidus]|uniref:Solute-binding protein family 5 domain-containing protein n=1 Tax=Haladaptatus pallidirubidus TaxID=1008152 RepID=A0AAV3UPG2_9EURY|nr:ABC transporter substrate-binding protein [Haladaptatus pallidirubidus]
MPSYDNGDLKSDSKMPAAFNRRKFLGAVGSAGIAGIAGCGGQQYSPNSNGSNGKDNEFTSYMNIPPQDAQFNRMRPQNYGENVASLAYDMFAKYDYYSKDKNWHPMIAEDWKLPDKMEEGAVVTVNISKNHMWHNGNPVTAKDIENQFLIEKGLEMSVWNFLKDVKVVDDKTVEFTLSGPVNEEILLVELFDRPVDMPNSIFGEYAKKFQEAKSEADKKAVQEELLQFKLDKPMGNGPFKHNKITDNKYILTKFEDYANPYITADDINLPKYGLRLSPGGSAVPQFIINKEIDGTPQTDPQPEQLDRFPQGHVTTHPGFVGEGVILNISKTKYFDNRLVRKALGHVITRKHLRMAMPGPSDLYGSIPTPTGIMPNKAKEIIGDKLDSFEKYAYKEPNHKRATELLKKEGFKKNGEAWHTPDGNRWTLSVKSHTAATWLSVAQAVSADLEQFGIKVEQTQQEDSTFFGETIPNGNFDLAACNWGGGGANLPYANFQTHFYDRKDSDGYPVPSKVDIPMPAGNPNGSIQTVDVRKKISELGVASDEAQRKKLITEIAWAYNQSAHHFPARVWEAIAYVSTEQWKFPDPKNDVDMHLDRPTYWPIRKGKHNMR